MQADEEKMQTEDEAQEETDRHSWPGNKDLWLDSRMEDWMERERRLR